MNRTKSVFVTSLVAVMLLAIIIGLYLLKNKAYLIIAGLLGIYGFLCAAINFCQWLGKETPLLPQLPKTIIRLQRDEEPQQVESNHEIMGYEK